MPSQRFETATDILKEFPYLGTPHQKKN
jgi:hypothetical protein